MSYAFQFAITTVAAALTFLAVRWATALAKRGANKGGGASAAAAAAAAASGTRGAEQLVQPRRLAQRRTLSAAADGGFSGEGRPRVLVMGFFDMLHHGHIAFLKCAAKFGDVVVVVGRDANHFARKNRYPIMGEQIRLVAVRELRVVTDAVLAKGLGLLDFEDNLTALRPIDAIFATQDNDRAEVEAFCNERGMEYIVRPKPSLSAIFGVDLPEMHPKHIRASFEMAFRDSPGGGGAPRAMGVGIGMSGAGANSAGGGDAPLRLRTVSSSEHLHRLSSTSLSSLRSPHSPFSSPLRAPMTAPGATPPPSPGSTAAGAGAAVSANDFPWRLCIGGGWLDQPWVSEKHAGACIVVNVLPNVNFRSHCGLATSTRKIGMLLWGGSAAGDGAAGRGRGRGAQRGAPPPNTSCEERARLLFGACNPPYSDYVLGAGGSLGLMLPRINRLDFDGECVELTARLCAPTVSRRTPRARSASLESRCSRTLTLMATLPRPTAGLPCCPAAVGTGRARSCRAQVRNPSRGWKGYFSWCHCSSKRARRAGRQRRGAGRRSPSWLALRSSARVARYAENSSTKQ